MATAGNKAIKGKSNRIKPRKLDSEVAHRKGSGVISFLLTFLILAFFWVLFSGKFDLFHLMLGAVSCTIIALANKDLLFPQGVGPGLVVCWIKFIGYLPWLFYQIFLANLHLLYLTFHPDMRALIDPKMIEFKSRLTSDMARVTFANSITLTPGTISAHVSVMGDFVVHCIDEKSASALPGEMEARIARVFNE